MKDKSMIKKFVEQIKDVEYISFDIFDTLMFRSVPQPYDQLMLIQIWAEENEGISCNSFADVRMRAEKEARRDANGLEVSLDDIYNKISCYSDKLKCRLKDLECEIEQKICIPNPPMIDILNWCVSKGKHVIITTDMYLPRTIIHGILVQIGVTYERLFISSEKGVTKRSGKLFSVVLNKLGLNPWEIIHIGDDINNDINQPHKYGIKGILRLVNDVSILQYVTKKRTPQSDYINELIKRRFSNSSIYTSSERIGYGVMGPLMVDFCQWLHEQKLSIGLEKLMFVSREGYLIWQCYQILYPEDKKDVAYVCLNKNIMRLPLLCVDSSVHQFLTSMPDRHDFLWGDICKYLRVDNVEKFLFRLRQRFPYLDVKSPISRKSLISGTYDKEIHYVIETQLGKIKEQKDLFDSYLLELGFYDKKIGLVNNSIQGSGQFLLEKYIKKNGSSCSIHGLQFTCTTKCSARLGDRFSAFFNQKKFPHMYKYYAIEYCFILEHLMFESIGTALCFERRQNAIQVVHEPQRHESLNNAFVESVIKEALQFCSDYGKRLRLKLNGIGADLFIRMCSMPFMEDSQTIGTLWDDDVEEDRKLVSMVYPFKKIYKYGISMPKSIL